ASMRMTKNSGSRAGAAALRVSIAQGRGDPAEQSAQSEVSGAGRDLAAAAASGVQRNGDDAAPYPGLVMGDAAQWVRGLVGRRADAAGGGRQRSRAGARV